MMRVCPGTELDLAGIRPLVSVTPAEKKEPAPTKNGEKRARLVKSWTLHRHTPILLVKIAPPPWLCQWPALQQLVTWPSFN